MKVDRAHAGDDVRDFFGGGLWHLFVKKKIKKEGKEEKWVEWVVSCLL